MQALRQFDTIGSDIIRGFSIFTIPPLDYYPAAQRTATFLCWTDASIRAQVKTGVENT